MLIGNFREAKEKEIIIENTSFNAFKELLHFLYFNEILFENSSEHEIYDTFDLLDRFEILRVGSKEYNPIKLTDINQKYIYTKAFEYKYKHVCFHAMIFFNNKRFYC